MKAIKAFIRLVANNSATPAKGKYKAINVDKAPLNYLNWVIHNIELNKSETTLIRKLIKSEMEKNQLNKTNKTTSNSSS